MMPERAEDDELSGASSAKLYTASSGSARLVNDIMRVMKRSSDNCR